jgi:hypothetical protein
MPSVDNEDVVPDIADAMAELDSVRTASESSRASLAPEGKSLLKKVSKKSGGQASRLLHNQNIFFLRKRPGLIRYFGRQVGRSVVVCMK